MGPANHVGGADAWKGDARKKENGGLPVDEVPTIYVVEDDKTNRELMVDLFSSSTSM